MTQNTEKISQAKNAISALIIRERGVNAVEPTRDAVVIHIDPDMPDTRERIQKIIGPIAVDVPVVYLESGPYRKFPAT